MAPCDSQRSALYPTQAAWQICWSDQCYIMVVILPQSNVMTRPIIQADMERQGATEENQLQIYWG